jgi:regulator of protease activity HflC (stomatin/prohibitin superfamily)
VAEAQKKEAKILAAQADAISTNALAGARAFTAVSLAEADRQRMEVTAVARAAAFTNQIPAFNAAPSVYMQRAYFQAFAKATEGARKYVLLTTNTSDVFEFDLKDSVLRDYGSLTVPAPKK